MKFFLDLECQSCKSPCQVVVHLNATHLQWRCEQCGHENEGLYESTVGRNILIRSSYELTKVQDYSMCIVLAAMAFEAELSRLHRKWRNIEAGLAGMEIDDVALEEQLRKYGNIAEKINAVAAFLCPKGLEKFVESEKNLREALGRFPSLQGAELAKAFQQHLFWPRNRILHAGHATYSKSDAERSFGIADFGLIILNTMDRARAARLDASFNITGSKP